MPVFTYKIQNTRCQVERRYFWFSYQ